MRELREQLTQMFEQDHRRLMATLRQVTADCQKGDFVAAAAGFEAFSDLQLKHLTHEDAALDELRDTGKCPPELRARIGSQHAEIRQAMQEAGTAVGSGDDSGFVQSIDALSRAVDAHEWMEREHVLPLLTRAVIGAPLDPARYRTLFDCCPVPLAVLSRDGVVLEVNGRWRDVLGVDASTLIGRRIDEFAPAGDVASNREQFEASFASAHRSVAAVLRPDGSVIHMEFATQGVVLEGKTVALTAGMDVTDRVTTARSLDATEGQLRRMLERSPDLMWTADVDGRIEFITPNVERITGFRVEEFIAANAAGTWPNVHPDDRPMVIAKFREGFATRTPFSIEYRRLTRDGSWRWVRNRAFAFVDGPKGLRAEGMLSDITEQRQLGDALRQSQKIEAIGQLTGGIAHDFNNMLAVITSSVYQLLEELAEGDPRREDATEIKLAAERAAALTRQLLTFSRRQVVALEAIDLNATVTGLQKMLTRLIGEDIALTVAPTRGAGCVYADAGQLEQVIVNLAVNARDAMPEGGRLTVATRGFTLSPAEAAAIPATPGRYVELTVTDTGTGIDAETQRRMFEPFFTTKPIGKGTGLGLSTSYGIVKQSGGYIAVSSEPGHGATFRVCLPWISASPDEVATPAERAPVRGGKETVLVVEDDDAVRGVLGRILRELGYKVLAARDGAEALAFAVSGKTPIDLVLSDVVMAGQQGPQVISALRRELGEGLKAIYMSGYTDHPLLLNGTLHPGLHFIQKPFAPDLLARRVREVLDA